eukprot:TRINITY_DN2156_c1_g2_i1.p1 TRINITY_DN2156_c1_g2~~TRINITY_DN2156_c1_g2_i1.p1  ORF type:complete len:100 (-),score=0.50 TRINITY_DN2156_c1_g2_i1:6-305(-)
MSKRSHDEFIGANLFPNGLPSEVTATILSFVDEPRDLTNLALVNKCLHAAASADSVWKPVVEKILAIPADKVSPIRVFMGNHSANAEWGTHIDSDKRIL